MTQSLSRTYIYIYDNAISSNLVSNRQNEMYIFQKYITSFSMAAQKGERYLKSF